MRDDWWHALRRLVTRRLPPELYLPLLGLALLLGVRLEPWLRQLLGR